MRKGRGGERRKGKKEKEYKLYRWEGEREAE